jgi:tetratricopeptide (TPR) repeat protein
VSDGNPTMPRELGRIIRRCLEKDPARRIQTALDLRNELEDLRTETTSAISAAGVPVTPAPASSPSTIVMPRRSPAWAAGLGLALLLVAGYLAWARWHGAVPATTSGPDSATTGPALTVKRFENRTNDPSLDPVGAMAADAITQAIPQLDFLSRVSSGTSDAKPAARTRAIVTGAYYLDGQNLRVQASLADTTGSVLYAIEPAVGPRSDPGAVVGLAQQRMLGAVVTILDPTNLIGRHSRPPLYNAYREFVAGMDLFGNDYPGALQHLKRATELDPDFFAPLWTMCAVYANTFDRQGRLDTLARIAPMRDRLSRFERLRFDTEIANADGRQLDGLKALRQAEEVDPENLVVNYLIGHYALRLNRPQETLDEYAKVNAARWDVSTPGGWRYTRMTSANHLLGRHEEELRVAITAKKIFPSALATRADEMYALAALGRIDDLRRAADDLLSLGQSPSAGTLGGALRTVANELRTHGHRAESTELAMRGIARYRGRPQDVQQRENIRSGLAQALYVVEQWEDAAKIVVTLLNEHRDNPVYVGLAGAIAARMGNRDAALKHSAALARMPADGGVASLLRAQIAAVLGDKQAAMDLLRDAAAQGYPYSLTLHQNVDFESLRGYAPFDEFMRPKG